jgi:hypothetical protein
MKMAHFLLRYPLEENAILVLSLGDFKDTPPPLGRLLGWFPVGDNLSVSNASLVFRLSFSCYKKKVPLCHAATIYIKFC